MWCVHAYGHACVCVCACAHTCVCACVVVLPTHSYPHCTKKTHVIYFIILGHTTDGIVSGLLLEAALQFVPAKHKQGT